MAETCQLAVHRLEWLLSADKPAEDESTAKNPYCSVDPAPPAVRKSVPELRQALLNESLPLFERYRAMFALRNLGSEEAVLALAAGKPVLLVSVASPLSHTSCVCWHLGVHQTQNS